MSYAIFKCTVKLAGLVVFLSSCNLHNVKSDKLTQKSLSLIPYSPITQDQGLKNSPTNTSQKPGKFSGIHTGIKQTQPKKMAMYCNKKDSCLYTRGNTVYANGRGGMIPTRRTVREITDSKRSGFTFRGYGYYRIRQQ